MAAKSDDNMPGLSSDEDSKIQEHFTVRDHDYNKTGGSTGKLTSIRSIDLVREYLEINQVEPIPIQIPWESFKLHLLTKCDEIKRLSQEFIAHRLGIQNKEQTALFNNLELKEVVLAMLTKKRTVRRAFKHFIRGIHTAEQKIFVISKVK